jgi:hypothetical protein
LVALQQLFQILNLKNRLKKCFQHIKIHPIYGFANIIILLIIHLTLGYRRIKDLKYCVLSVSLHDQISSLI